MICRLLALTIAATGGGIALGLLIGAAIFQHLEMQYRAARDAEETEPEFEYAVTFSEDGGRT